MIQVDRDGATWTLTLARPEKANALNRGMLQDLAEAVLHASQHHATRAIIVTGTGKVFSAGADLDEVHKGLATDPVWENLSGALASAHCLTIAALNGTAAGGALGMVLAADLRIAVPEATFFYPVMKLGVLPQPSDPARLTRLVGPARAKMMLIGGTRMSAADAREFGLVDLISPDPVAAAVALATDAARATAEHIASIKAMIETA